MKFNIYYQIRKQLTNGAHSGLIEMPDHSNPWETASLGDLLQFIGKNLPTNPILNATPVGIRIIPGPAPSTRAVVPQQAAVSK